jgi:4-amino-4-deoxy-L-arabinose transferase-like glycosyltransferase
MKLHSPTWTTQLWKLGARHPAIVWMSSIVGLLIICSIAFFWHLGSKGLVDETEPLFAEAARQMFVTGDWITPMFNGEPRFDKPPLIYWMMVIAYHMIGVNEWAVRLPSAIAALALVGFGFYLLWRFGPASKLSHPLPNSSPQTQPLSPWLTAGIGASLMALNLQTIIWARTGVSDMLLSACTGMALMAFFMAYAQPEHPTRQARWYWTFYVLTALAVLTKGPIGMLLPALIIGSFLLYVGNGWQVVREMRLMLGVLLTLSVSLPWYGLIIGQNGLSYIAAFFGYHNLERFTSVVNRHSAPWYFYFLIVLVGFMPWSGYLPAAIARLQIWKRHDWQQQARATHLGLFALFWVLSIFGFFTIAVTKLPSYILPLMPAAAILVGLCLSDWITQRRMTTGFTLSTIGQSILLMALAGGIFWIPHLLGRDPAAPNFRTVLQQTQIPAQGLGVLAGTALAIIAVYLKRRFALVWGVNTLGFLVFLLGVLQPLSFLVDQQRQLPLRQLSTTMRQVQRPQEPLLMVGIRKPTLVFYTHQSVRFISRAISARNYLQTQVMQQPHASMLVLLQRDRLPGLQLQPNQYQLIQQTDGYLLIRVANTLSN